MIGVFHLSEYAVFIINAFKTIEIIGHFQRFYATDINAVSLASAKKGAFQTARLSEYEANSRSAGITTMVQQIATLDGKWGYFDETLKRNIIFAMHNLAADTSFNEFNLILCRNVLYYFNHELQ